MILAPLKINWINKIQRVQLVLKVLEAQSALLVPEVREAQQVTRIFKSFTNNNQQTTENILATTYKRDLVILQIN